MNPVSGTTVPQWSRIHRDAVHFSNGLPGSSFIIGKLLVLWFMLLLAGCGGQAEEGITTQDPNPAASTPAASTGKEIDLNVFAAASLTGPFEEFGVIFQRANPGVRVSTNFGGSQQLVQQINSGAPADVFASANSSQMDALVLAGLVEPGSAKVFVRNKLVVVIPSDNPGSIAELEDLARPGKKIVLVAKEVPAGQYTLEFLDLAAGNARFGPAFRDGILANVVSYEENVRAALQKVVLGEADAGIVYVSDAAGGQNLILLDIPDALNPTASYPIAVLKDSPEQRQAQDFVDLVLSTEGQQVLAKYGFLSGTE